MSATFSRIEEFCRRFGLNVPILLAPMAGVRAVRLSIEVANAGGAGACGVLMMPPHDIAEWVREFRLGSSGAFQLNTWIPDPPPARDAGRESLVRAFLERWGPPLPSGAGDNVPPDFDSQVAAMIAARPPIVSSIMGVFPPPVVAALRANNIAWFAVATTVAEARAAEAAGADVVVAQGAEAGGHRGSFDAAAAERRQIGLMSLVPAVVDAVRVPVVAAGGIADGRGAAAAFALGASGIQIGTGFLRCPEAAVHPAWAAAIGSTMPEDTMLTRAFSGRAARSIANEYVLAAASDGAPSPAPYPVQRALTAPMRAEAQKAGDIRRMQAWAGQSAALAKSAAPPARVVADIWQHARGLLA